MTGRLWSYYAGFVIVLAMLLGGGTMQGLWTDRVIQLALIPAILVGLGRLDDSRWMVGAKIVAVLSLLLYCFQFLPAGRLWPSAELAISSGTFLTVTAGRTFESLLFYVPLLAFAVFVSRLNDVTQEGLIRFFIIGLLLNLIVGSLQLSQANRAGVELWLMPYALNAGVFVNENHFSALVYSIIPLVGYLLLSRQDRPGLFLALCSAMLVYLFAIGSRASIPISMGLAAITLALYWRRLQSTRLVKVAAVVAVGAAAAIMYANPNLLAIEDRSRQEMFSTTLRAALDYLPFGTGSGSFQPVYAFYEDKTLISHAYVNHAHNDFLEIFLETGLPGVLLLIGFFALVILSPNSPLRSACKLAILALSLHSLVDYPLRTFGVGIYFAFLAGIVLQTQAARAPQRPRRSHSSGRLPA